MSLSGLTIIIVHIIKYCKGSYSVTVSDANNCLHSSKPEYRNTAYPICIVTIDKDLGTNKIVWEKFEFKY